MLHLERWTEAGAAAWLAQVWRRASESSTVAADTADSQDQHDPPYKGFKRWLTTLPRFEYKYILAAAVNIEKRPNW